MSPKVKDNQSDSKVRGFFGSSGILSSGFGSCFLVLGSRLKFVGKSLLHFAGGRRFVGVFHYAVSREQRQRRQMALTFCRFYRFRKIKTKSEDDVGRVP
jgi:hypothetical protein